MDYFLPPYHERILDTESPLALALAWGVIATWWVGLIGGVALALGMRAGRLPKLLARDLARPLVLRQGMLYLFVMLLGFGLYHSSLVQPRELGVTGIMHAASYLGGVGVIASLFWWALSLRSALARDCGSN